MLLRLIILLSLNKPINSFLASIISFTLGVNIHTEMHEAINYFLQQFAFIISIVAGLFTIYSVIRKNTKNKLK